MVFGNLSHEPQAFCYKQKAGSEKKTAIPNLDEIYHTLEVGDPQTEFGTWERL